MLDDTVVRDLVLFTNDLCLKTPSTKEERAQKRDHNVENELKKYLLLASVLGEDSLRPSP